MQSPTTMLCTTMFVCKFVYLNGQRLFRASEWNAALQPTYSTNTYYVRSPHPATGHWQRAWALMLDGISHSVREVILHPARPSPVPCSPVTETRHAASIVRIHM